MSVYEAAFCPICMSIAMCSYYVFFITLFEWKLRIAIAQPYLLVASFVTLYGYSASRPHEWKPAQLSFFPVAQSKQSSV